MRFCPSNVPTFAKAEPEGCRQLRTGRGRGGEPADSIDHPHLLLRFRGDRRKNETNSENNREPDQPHGHLGEDGWRESSRPELLAVGAPASQTGAFLQGKCVDCPEELAALVEHRYWMT